jgi:hypothetical protein
LPCMELPAAGALTGELYMAAADAGWLIWLRAAAELCFKREGAPDVWFAAGFAEDDDSFVPAPASVAGAVACSAAVVEAAAGPPADLVRRALSAGDASGPEDRSSDRLRHAWMPGPLGFAEWLPRGKVDICVGPWSASTGASGNKGEPVAGIIFPRRHRVYVSTVCATKCSASLLARLGVITK